MRDKSLLNSVRTIKTHDHFVHDRIFDSAYTSVGRFIYREIRWALLSKFNSANLSDTIRMCILNKYE